MTAQSSKAWNFTSRLFQRLGVLALLLFHGLEGVAAETVTLTVRSDHVVGRIDERIYGQFLEHIYHSCNGGLWGDIVWNRSFEELTPVKKGEQQAPDAFARHWEQIGAGLIALDTNAPLNSRKCVRIVADAAGSGVAQKNYCVRRGDLCRGSLWLRGAAADGLFVRLLDGRKVLAEQVIPAPTAKSWDMSSIHKYENYGGGGRGIEDDTNRFWRGVATYDSFLSTLCNSYAKSSNPGLKFYVSEWNYMSTDWRTGLYAGGMLNVFERHGDIVAMACPALLLRHVVAPEWDNAFINFDHRGWFPAPNYVVMKLWRDHFATTRLALDGDAGTLNVIATKSDNGHEVFLKLVNPSNQETPVKLSVAGSFKPAHASLKLAAPGNLHARNTLEKRETVRVAPGRIKLVDGHVEFALPRWSAAVLELER